MAMCSYTHWRIQNTFTFNNITTAPPVNVYFANSLWQYAVFHWHINNSEKFSLVTNFTEPSWRKCPPTVLGGKCKSVFGWRLCCWAETWERNTNNGLQIIVMFVWLCITRELKYFGWALLLFITVVISIKKIIFQVVIASMRQLVRQLSLFSSSTSLSWTSKLFLWNFLQFSWTSSQLKRCVWRRARLPRSPTSRAS